MKKWHFTLKNGAFYPRIQSILAFFLSVFWERNINLFWMRKGRLYMRWEKKRCVKYKGRCVFHYLLTLLRSRRSQKSGPPLHVERSSSGHFPPPRTPEYRTQTNHASLIKATIVTLITLTWFVCRYSGVRGGSRALRLVTCSTFRWGAPTHPHPRKTRKT
jgi:hypothetical protein